MFVFHVKGEKRRAVRTVCEGVLLLCGRMILSLKKNTYLLNRNFILVVGKVYGLNKQCGFIIVYAPNDEGRKAALWDVLLNDMDKKDV